MANYVAKSFAILDLFEDAIKRSRFIEREAAENILRLNDLPKNFVCEEHGDWGAKFVNKIVINILYNNSQKESLNSVRQNAVKDFKKGKESWQTHNKFYNVRS